jgi:hypothetical protein
VFSKQDKRLRNGGKNTCRTLRTAEQVAQTERRNIAGFGGGQIGNSAIFLSNFINFRMDSAEFNRESVDSAPSEFSPAAKLLNPGAWPFISLSR